MNKSNRSRRRTRKGKNQKNQAITAMEVSQPAAKAIVLSRAKPVLNGQAGSLRVRHHEILTTIVSTADKYTVRAINLIPSSCTWLKNVAVNFSKWRWLSLNIVYVPTCATSTPGDIDMALQYDGNDTLASTPEELSVMNGHAGGPLWSGTAGCKLVGASITNENSKPPQAIATVVDVNKFPKRWYNYTSQNLTGDSITIYCPCDLQYGVTAGVTPAAGGIGRLWISYEIELIEPIPAGLNK